MNKGSLIKIDSTQSLLDSEIPPRRTFLAQASASILGGALSGGVLADTLADVPMRSVGGALGGHSERSEFVQISRLPEAGPGLRNVDPSNVFNSKTPLHKLVGTITPSDLHFERSHSGVPSLNPKTHRLLVHGMTEKSVVFTLDDLRSMPSVSRIAFLECSGNGWENWEKADESLTVQNLYGLLSMHEWTGVPLAYLLDSVGKKPESTWMLAEGGDASGMARSIPLTSEIVGEAIIAYAQNGEALRPAHGFPLRLIVPGFEGNLSVKWLRRLKFSDQPFMTRWETARYTSLLPNGKARQFHLRQEVNSVITSPSGTMSITPGYHRIAGIAWSGHGVIQKVELSTDGGESWREANLNQPILSKALTRFEFDWEWGGQATKITSRSTDEKGNIQPNRSALIEEMGTNAMFHFNAQQTWSIDAKGKVRNVLA